ncbi:MAG: DUF5320 domain-containing protein [Bacilli bacterium]|jgi:hypothetical protein
MPRGDGTGPRGLGPNTGRGFGYCNPRPRRYHRYGRFGGRNFGYRNFAMYELSDKEAMLQRKKILEEEIENINKLLDDIK